MPRARRARATRSRARKAKRRSAPSSLILDIEVPLTDAIHYVQAMRLMGQGLVLTDDTGGDAIVALAYQTSQRLAKVQEIWNGMLEERRRARRA